MILPQITVMTEDLCPEMSHQFIDNVDFVMIDKEDVNMVSSAL